MTILTRFFLILLFSILALFASAQSNSASTDDMYIVLLAGQSNMAGRGVSRPALDTISYANIFSLNKDSVWVRAKNPLHWDKTEAAVGMGITFAHELALKMGGNVKIGLVPCAAGGTYIDQWINNSYFANTGNFYLYTNLIKRAKRAAKSGKIIGMIWHQGESDAVTSKYVGYKTRMNTLFRKIRTDLNIPTMPIVAGELGYYLVNNSSYPRWDSINNAINKLKLSLPNYDVVSASGGLTCNSDKTHFTSESQVILGTRYATAFYPLATTFLSTTAIENPKSQPFRLTVIDNKLHVYLENETSAKVLIYNAQGILMKSTVINNLNHEIDTFTLKGIYLACIQTSNGITTRKIYL